MKRRKRITAVLMSIITVSAYVCFIYADKNTDFHTDSSCEWEGGKVFYGCGSDCVALTFDDGPHPEHTDSILSVLEKYDVKATFFCVGENIEYNPDVFRRVISAGHEVGNHTYRHTYLKGRRDAEVYCQIRQADDVVYNLAECLPHFLRPPGGLYDKKLLNIAEREDKVIAMWTIDTLDWRHKNVDEIIKTVTEQTRGGDIILMHDYITGTSHTAEALDKIIPTLKSRGYVFVTLSDMYFNYHSE